MPLATLLFSLNELSLFQSCTQSSPSFECPSGFCYLLLMSIRWWNECLCAHVCTFRWYPRNAVAGAEEVGLNCPPKSLQTAASPHAVCEGPRPPASLTLSNLSIFANVLGPKITAFEHISLFRI